MHPVCVAAQQVPAILKKVVLCWLHTTNVLVVVPVLNLVRTMRVIRIRKDMLTNVHSVFTGWKRDKIPLVWMCVRPSVYILATSMIRTVMFRWH